MTDNLPPHLTLAVDCWFRERTGLGGCSDKDVSELAEIFYGVQFDGGRESVDDAMAIVEYFGPGISGLNDTFARQVLLAAEVKRLRAALAQAQSCVPALWAIHVPGPDDYYPAPSEEAANHMVSKHNAAMTEATQDPNAIIKRGDLPKLIGVCSDTVRKMVNAGKLPPLDVNLSRKTRGWKRSTLVAAGVKV